MDLNLIVISIKFRSQTIAPHLQMFKKPAQGLCEKLASRMPNDLSVRMLISKIQYFGDVEHKFRSY